MKLSANLFVHKMDKYNITFIRMPFAGSQNKATLSIAFPHSLDDLDHAYENLRSGAVELNYTRESIKLFLPKFRIESSIDLQPILKDLGISEIFDKPDLSGVTKEPVKVDSVTQNVYIDVHERGAEAAVSTTALLSGRILSTSKAITTEYHVDRPFFFCVQYNEVVLLAGRVINPLLR
ncbi:hypothetical protein HHI36_012206 [Cryptolaemus montrouzieri]|uniref:Serpin domain-containing protein n=1 Tax=Cryptolaemus montrouzieri TaxID=559131 RepID=A0ABD2NDM4_9CUCU